ncbi:L-lactate permease [Pseudonocardia sp. RS010]|uniref:L-lactate permease n=1 Tax=Pseudonocardia sp. RS010 TaxID=3385979 RepID=UPI0039A0096C
MNSGTRVPVGRCHAGSRARRKMVSPQNLTIAVAAVKLDGPEGVLLRKVFGWSLGMLVVLAILIYLQSTPVLGWILP